MFRNIDAEQGRLKLSNESLAEKLGVTRRTLYSWKKNGGIPASAIIKMMKIFDCTADYLLGQSDKRH